MFEFNKLCKAFEEMDPRTFTAIIAEKSAMIIAALTAITKDGMDGMKIYTNFILCSIAADGKLAEEEYVILRPAFEALVHKLHTFLTRHQVNVVFTVSADPSQLSDGVRELVI